MFQIEPIDGWGFSEKIDGKLADPFDAEIIESGVKFDSKSIGWRAMAVNGKYAGSCLELTPRHVDWTEVIVLWVYPPQQNEGYLFSGMANTRGLECNWK